MKTVAAPDDNVVQPTRVAVYVTRETRPHTGTDWFLFADYRNEHEAHLAAERALADDGHAHAEVRVSTVISRRLEKL